jgi:small GTP-binding protein
MREKRKPSERLTKKISQTYDYFLQHVDPLIGESITYLLSEQPSNVSASLMAFLKAKQENLTLVPSGKNSANEKPRRELKVFLATSIAPVIAGLVNRIAIERPEDVLGFMTLELEKLSANPAYFSEQTGAQAHVPTAGAPAKDSKPKKAEMAPDAEIPVQEKNIQLVVVGLGGSGKSSILNMVQGKLESKVRPTVGFRPLSMMLSEDTKVRFYDLGGGKKIRDIWTQYYHDVHGVVYVVDGSTPQEEMESCIQTFAETVNHPFLAGKPTLVFVNKQDKEESLCGFDFGQMLQPYVKSTESFIEFADSCAAVPEVIPEDFEADPRIEASLLHLLNQILADFDVLNERVRADSLRKSAEEAQKRVAKERKVLKNKIACAFLQDVDQEFVAAHQIEADPGNIFSEEEGLTYLASEIGEEVGNLPAQAKEIAHMVGYQKLALTIIGGLKSPVSKKKVPMEWQELHDLIADLRRELGLHQLPAQ